MCLYVIESTVGFESNLNNNAVRKKEKYLNLIKEMSRNYRCVKFVNLPMSSLLPRMLTFLDMMNNIGIDKKQQHYIIKKIINIAIRATYYIFCCRNRNWGSPHVLQLDFDFCCFVFCFFFNNSISSSQFIIYFYNYYFVALTNAGLGNQTG